MAKIDQNLDFLFYFAPIQFTLATNFHYFFANIVQGGWQKLKDEYEDPWGPHQGVPQVPKVPKWPQDGSLKDQYWPFLDLWDPLVGPPGVLKLVYQFLLLPFDKISVKTIKICCQSELDGSKIEKIQYLGILAIFGPFGPPFSTLWGIRSRLSFSTTLKALDQCENNTNFLPE